MKFKYTVEPGSSKAQWKVLENGDMIAVCQNETNAVTMIGILNAYDTLKAKAELLDEAVSKLEMVLGFLNHCKDELSHRGETQLHKDWIEKVLAKAKELK